MRALKLKKEQYLRRRKRSKKAFANKDEMRVCIFKSTNHIEAQIIDDFNQKTIVSASSKEKEFSKKKLTYLQKLHYCSFDQMNFLTVIF